MNNGKITQNIIQEISKYIEIGLPNRDAAQACGICEATFYNWIQRGQKAKKGLYLEFLESLKKANARHMARNAAIIEKAAQEGRWQASAWMLERRHPDEWGNKQFQHIEHSAKDDKPILIEMVYIKDKNDVKRLEDKQV